MVLVLPRSPQVQGTGLRKRGLLEPVWPPCCQTPHPASWVALSCVCLGFWLLPATRTLPGQPQEGQQNGLQAASERGVKSSEGGLGPRPAPDGRSCSPLPRHAQETGCGERLLVGNQRQLGAGPGGGSSSEGPAGLPSLECMKAARREVRGRGTGPILSGSLLFRTSCQAAQGIVGMS